MQHWFFILFICSLSYLYSKVFHSIFISFSFGICVILFAGIFFATKPYLHKNCYQFWISLYILCRFDLKKITSVTFAAKLISGAMFLLFTINDGRISIYSDYIIIVCIVSKTIHWEVKKNLQQFLSLIFTRASTS